MGNAREIRSKQVDCLIILRFLSLTIEMLGAASIQAGCSSMFVCHSTCVVVCRRNSLHDCVPRSLTVFDRQGCVRVCIQSSVHYCGLAFMATHSHEPSEMARVV